MNFDLSLQVSLTALQKTWRYFKANSSNDLSVVRPICLDFYTSRCSKVCVDYSDTTTDSTEGKPLRLCVEHTHTCDLKAAVKDQLRAAGDSAPIKMFTETMKAT